MVSFDSRILAIPAVLTLIFFLSYSSQYLFISLAPRPLTTKESVYFNISLVSLLICYARAILTNPGRVPNTIIDASKDQISLGQGESNVLAKQRWCRVCQQHKPPRSHHCRVCKRYFQFYDQKRQVLIRVSDAFRRWITTVPGHIIACLIERFPISFDSFSSQ